MQSRMMKLSQAIADRPAVLRSQTVVSLFIWVVGLWAAWIFGGWIAAGDLNSLSFAAVGLTVCAVGVAILRNWRSGFYTFLVWLLFEDLVRKYLGNNMIIYFAKDVLVGFTYISLLLAIRQRRAPLFRFPFMIFLSMFFWLGALQCFNPNSPSIFYGLLGLKLYFYYIPLMFVGYALIRSDDDLKRFLILNMSLASVIALLGIIQSIKGPTFLNPRILAPDIADLSTLYRYSPTTGQLLYRPTSVFVSDGRFALYLLLTWLVGLGAAGFFLLKRWRGQFFVLCSIALVAAGVLLSGSRGTFMILGSSTLILAGAFLWGTPWRWGEGHRLVKTIRHGFIAAGLGLSLAVVLFPAEVGARIAFYSETLSPYSPDQELTHRVGNYPWTEFTMAFAGPDWRLGHGIGTASLGVQYVSHLLGKKPANVGVENGYGIIVIEFGILGLVLWILWTARLLAAAWKVVRNLRKTPYFPVAFSIFWFALLLLYPLTYASMNPFQNYICNAYLWLMIGILFRLPTLASKSELPAVLPNGS
jgi:hypothetical protein